MSDFSKLLGNLESSAKKVVLLETSSKRISNKSERSCADEDEDGEKSRLLKRQKVIDESKKSALPKDYNQLSVKISFMGIGAQKAGTSWFHHMLRLHNRLSLPKQKEVHFWDWHRRRGLRWYSQQFPRQGVESKIHGEITPCYSVLEEADISEIKALFPDLKLIFIARDIIDRAWSALMMELRNSVLGLEAGSFANEVGNMTKRDLERIEKESDPSQYDDDYFMDRLTHSTHSKRSDYAKALRLWLKHFPKEQLLIINYKDLSDRPRYVLKEVCEHIGVESETFLKTLSDDTLHQRVNVGKTKQGIIRPELRKKMEEYLKPFIEDFNNLNTELGYEWAL